MARESFIVYKSFYGLIKLLKAQQRLDMYEAIFEYGFTGAEPTFKDDTSSAIWQAILPQLKANQRRYENGLKGGAPMGNSNARKNNQDSEEKTTEKQPTGAEKNNLTLTEKTTEKQPNENVNENDNENVNVFKVSKKERKNIYLKNNTQGARDVNFAQMSDAELIEFGKKPIDMSSDDAFEIINAYSKEVAKRKDETKKWKGKIIKGNGKFEELESHDAIIQSYHFSDSVRDKIKDFLRHCALNKRLIVNDKLRDILDELCNYSEDSERIEVIDKAISGGYFDIKRFVIKG